MGLKHASVTNYARGDLIDESGKGITEATAAGNPATRRKHLQDEALQASTGQPGLSAGNAAKSLLERFTGR